MNIFFLNLYHLTDSSEQNLFFSFAICLPFSFLSSALRADTEYIKHNTGRI